MSCLMLHIGVQSLIVQEIFSLDLATSIPTGEWATTWALTYMSPELSECVLRLKSRLKLWCWEAGMPSIINGGQDAAWDVQE